MINTDNHGRRQETQHPSEPLQWDTTHPLIDAFRPYERIGKFKVSYDNKLPDGTWSFRLAADAADKAAVVRLRAEAIDRANGLNGAPLEGGETEARFRRYFAWQRGLPAGSEDGKAESTLNENEEYEGPRILRTFGKVRPALIKPVHIYKYLDGRAAEGAPAKANKEIASLSAVVEFGRRKGVLELNPCRDISTTGRGRNPYAEEGRGGGRVHVLHAEVHAASSGDGPGRQWERDDQERYRTQQ